VKASVYAASMKKSAELFSRDELEKIHYAALEVLDYVGFTVMHDEAVKLLEASGANIDRDRWVVRVFLEPC